MKVASLTKLNEIICFPSSCLSKMCIRLAREAMLTLCGKYAQTNFKNDVSFFFFYFVNLLSTNIN